MQVFVAHAYGLIEDRTQQDQWASQDGEMRRKHTRQRASYDLCAFHTTYIVIVYTAANMWLYTYVHTCNVYVWQDTHFHITPHCTLECKHNHKYWGPVFHHSYSSSAHRLVLIFRKKEDVDFVSASVCKLLHTYLRTIIKWTCTRPLTFARSSWKPISTDTFACLPVQWPTVVTRLGAGFVKTPQEGIRTYVGRQNKDEIRVMMIPQSISHLNGICCT